MPHHDAAKPERNVPYSISSFTAPPGAKLVRTSLAPPNTLGVYTRIEMAHPPAARPRDEASTLNFPRKTGLQRRRPANSPRVGMLCLIVAAASLFLPASSAAGTGLGSAAAVKIGKRAAGAAAERETSSARGSARQQPRDEHDHDPRTRESPVSRRRRYARPGEEDSSGYAGSGSAGPRSRRPNSNSQSQRATPSSFGVLDRAGEEDEEVTGSSTGDGSDESQRDDLDDSSSCEDYDTEEGLYEEGTEDGKEGDLVRKALGSDGNSSEEDQLSDSEEQYAGYNSNRDGEGNKDELSPRHREGQQHNPREQAGRREISDDDNSVEVCVVTWNLAEESPPARDVEFLMKASRGSDLVAVGVQEIENLKPRRNEGGRTREWRRLLIRWVGWGNTR